MTITVDSSLILAVAPVKMSPELGKLGVLPWRILK
jgi:hypothetical protein